MATMTIVIGCSSPLFISNPERRETPGMTGRKYRSGEFGQAAKRLTHDPAYRSEAHPSELQSLMRIPYAVFCFKKKMTRSTHRTPHPPGRDNCTEQNLNHNQANNNK